MRIQTGIACCASQRFVVSVGDVFVCARILEPLGQSIVDQVNIVLPLANANEEIVRFDVTMEKTPRMNILTPLNHLVCQHQHSVERETTVAIVEQVFERGA